jgi:uncharacterized membrane protein YfcA
VRELKAILPGGLAGVVVGALVFGLMSDAMVKLMVGAISLVFVGRALWQARPGRIAPPPATPSRVRGGFWGMIAGFTSTIAHAGGPPLAVYLFPLRLDRRVLSATTAVFFGALNYVKLVPYFFLGQLDATNLLTALLLIPVAPVGVYIGIWLAARITDAWFYRVVYAMLGATGLKLVWDGLGL